MQEYVSEAIVLNKFPVREFDARYYFFTKRFGKMSGKATSARKITSKLAGHLEPGTLVHVRFVEKGGTQIVDALKTRRLDGLSLRDLQLLNTMLPESERDEAVWEELIRTPFSWERVLRVLGWDPEGALCEHCGRATDYFYLPRQEFFCAMCASKLKRDELLLYKPFERS